MICVSELIVKLVWRPLKATARTPEKPEPEMTTGMAVESVVGEKLVIMAGMLTTKGVVVVTEPLAVVRVIGPDVAPEGTYAVTCVSESTRNDVAATPLNETPRTLAKF